MINGRENRRTGFKGEETAKKFLKKNKYKILECNYSTRFGEVDIIALKEGYIVFAEVKTRGENSYGEPMEAVNSAKQKRILKAAEQYLMKVEYSSFQSRFDVIEVFKETGEIKHIINAF